MSIQIPAQSFNRENAKTSQTQSKIGTLSELTQYTETVSTKHRAVETRAAHAPNEDYGDHHVDMDKCKDHNKEDNEEIRRIQACVGHRQELLPKQIKYAQTKQNVEPNNGAPGPQRQDKRRIVSQLVSGVQDHKPENKHCSPQT